VRVHRTGGLAKFDIAKSQNQKKTAKYAKSAKEVKNYKSRYFSTFLVIFLGALGGLGGSKKDFAIVLNSTLENSTKALPRYMLHRGILLPIIE